MEEPKKPEREGQKTNGILQTPKKGISLNVILSVLILILVVMSLFFYFQNRQLKQMLLENFPKNVNEGNQTVSPASTVDPTVDWETYTTSTYQIKYPSNLIIKKDNGGVINISKWGPTQTEGTELFDGFSLNLIPREILNSNINSYVQTKIEEIKNQDVSEITKEPETIKINNYSGLTYEVRGLGDWKEIVLQSRNNIMFVEISIIVSDPENLGFSTTIDQILSTFKFIEPERSSEPETATPAAIPSL